MKAARLDNDLRKKIPCGGWGKASPQGWGTVLQGSVFLSNWNGERKLGRDETEREERGAASTFGL